MVRKVRKFFCFMRKLNWKKNAQFWLFDELFQLFVQLIDFFLNLSRFFLNLLRFQSVTDPPQNHIYSEVKRITLVKNSITEAKRAGHPNISFKLHQRLKFFTRHNKWKKKYFRHIRDDFFFSENNKKKKQSTFAASWWSFATFSFPRLFRDLKTIFNRSKAFCYLQIDREAEKSENNTFFRLVTCLLFDSRQPDKLLMQMRAAISVCTFVPEQRCLGMAFYDLIFSKASPWYLQIN